MAMNNWGGVTEHMTKKARRIFSNRAVLNYGKANDIPRLSLSKEELDRATAKHRSKMAKIWLIGIPAALILFLLFYLVYLNLPAII